MFTEISKFPFDSPDEGEYEFKFSKLEHPNFSRKPKIVLSLEFDYKFETATLRCEQMFTKKPKKVLSFEFDYEIENESATLRCERMFTKNRKKF